MLQADYTRKTQELAEQRKELSKYQDKNLDEAVSLWERLGSDPIGTIRFLEEHYAEQGITEPKDPAVLKYEMELAKKDAELKEKNSLIEAQAAKERQEGFNKHMNMLVDKYKDYNLDTKTVVQLLLLTISYPIRNWGSRHWLPSRLRRITSNSRRNSKKSRPMLLVTT
jgi:hypothetical protein